MKIIACIMHIAILVLPALCMQSKIGVHGVAIIILLVLFSIIEGRSSRLEHSNANANANANVSAIVSGLSLLAIAWLSIVSSRGTWLGVPVVIVGIALRAMALRDLGGGFTSAIEPRSILMTAGIYGRVRHPSEVGLLLISEGVVLLGGSNPAHLVMALVLTSSVVIRVVQEERALSARFGDAHARYRSSVHVVLPTLGRG